MIISGVKPTLPDKRDRNFHTTFGAVTSFADHLFTDAGLTNPNQNTDGHPEGCVRYATTELCNDEDNVAYDVGVVFHNMESMGTPPDAPADVRDGLESVIVYGIGTATEVVADWSKHRRGAYYAIDRTDDPFQGAMSAMTKYASLWGKPCSISVGSHWYTGFELVGQDGILSMPSPSDAYSQHNYKVCGWKTIDGIVYLIVKSWQGPEYGDGGYCYMSRELFNFLMDQYFSAAYVLAPFTGDYSTVKIDGLETMVGLLRRLGVSGTLLYNTIILIQKAWGLL